MHVQTRAQRSWARSAGGLARIHGDIDRRQRVLVQAKGLSREALDAVACNGGTKGARGDAQTQTRITFMIGHDRQTKIGVGEFFAALPNLAKFGRLMQSLARLERLPLETRCQGQRRLRPLARRRASNRRPLFVAMRARKPWVRARCKLLGLNVRFMAAGRLTKGGKGTERARMCQ